MEPAFDPVAEEIKRYRHDACLDNEPRPSIAGVIAMIIAVALAMTVFVTLFQRSSPARPDYYQTTPRALR